MLMDQVKIEEQRDYVGRLGDSFAVVEMNDSALWEKGLISHSVLDEWTNGIIT